MKNSSSSNTEDKYKLVSPCFYNSKLNPEDKPKPQEQKKLNPQTKDNFHSDNYRKNNTNDNGYNNIKNNTPFQNKQRPQQPQQPQVNQQHSLPQPTGFREFKPNPNVTNWFYRYNRNGYIKSEILAEDQELFKEHWENLKKKEQFNFNNLSTEETVKIYFKDNEVLPNSNNAIDVSKQTFKENVGLHKQVQENWKNMKYDQMTPIQKNIIPYILNRRDCWGCAQTGSGKTIAFLAPIVSLMINEGCPKEQPASFYTSYPVCLILVPTRELAEQIYKEARKVLHKTGITACKAYGGVPNDVQVRELKKGVDILIGTPGRIIEHIERKNIDLSMIKYWIIDESDRMLDMGFEDQMKEIVFNKDMTPKNQRNNLMFSATIPKNVLNISDKFMNESFWITSSNRDDVGSANSNVEQTFYYVEDKDKISKLHEVFQTIQGNAIVFWETKRSVDMLESFLNNRNYNVVAIHGDKVQTQRQEAIKLFSSGEVPILIATDVASRGWDFPNVRYVFNYDMPKNIEDYIHRIGRTGRVGNKGTAISFYNNKNSMIAKDWIDVLHRTNQDIPEFLNSGNSYSSYGKRGGHRGYGRGGYNNNSNYHHGNNYGNQDYDNNTVSSDYQPRGGHNYGSNNYSRGGHENSSNYGSGHDNGNNWKGRYNNNQY